jgi:hypothetical protein
VNTSKNKKAKFPDTEKTAAQSARGYFFRYQNFKFPDIADLDRKHFFIKYEDISKK